MKLSFLVFFSLSELQHKFKSDRFMSSYPLFQDESSDETIKSVVYDIELGQTSYEI